MRGTGRRTVALVGATAVAALATGAITWCYTGARWQWSRSEVLTATGILIAAVIGLAALSAAVWPVVTAARSRTTGTAGDGQSGLPQVPIAPLREVEPTAFTGGG
jgi:hypothetical protein